MDANSQEMANWANNRLQKGTDDAGAKGGGGGAKPAGEGADDHPDDGADDQPAGGSLSATLTEQGSAIQTAIEAIDAALKQDSGAGDASVLDKGLAKKLGRAHDDLADALEDLTKLTDDVKTAEQEKEDEEPDEEDDEESDPEGGDAGLEPDTGDDGDGGDSANG